MAWIDKGVLKEEDAVTINSLLEELEANVEG